MQNFLLLAACALMLSVAAPAQKKDAAPEKRNADIAKKIADATPPALPQSPKPDGARSDAQNENLKGKVKSITYRHDDDADLAYPRRMLTREEFFGEDGNLVRAIDYDDVHPRAVTVYGYVDKMRVSRSNGIDHAEGENGPRYPTVLTIVAEDPSKAPPKETRFDTRYILRYDERGRLIESRHLGNDGEMRVRTTYTYEKSNRRHLGHYAGGTEPLAQTTEILDRGGNVIEEWLYDEDKKINLIRTHAYTFDAQGNWTVRKTFEKETVKGKPDPKPVSTTHRTITYYP